MADIWRNPRSEKPSARQDERNAIRNRGRRFAPGFGPNPDRSSDRNLDHDRRHGHRDVLRGGAGARESFLDRDSGNRHLARAWALPDIEGRASL